MLLSGFTRFGFLRFAGGKSAPQKFYEALGAQLDKAFDTTYGLPQSEDNEAEKFALAMHLARVDVTLRKAGNQRDVTKATDLLPLREADFLATPGPFDTIYTRQQALLALRALPLGATQSNIASALTAALGSDFVKLRVMSITNDTVTDLPTSNFQLTTIVPKFLQLTLPLGVTGLQWATYGNLDPTITAPVYLNVGETVTVQGENNAQSEVVTVAAVQTTAAGLLQFQATFANGHDQGATVTTMNFPRWTSTQAILLVEVSAAAASDPIRRGKVDPIMAKLCRGFTQWATVTQSSPGVLGPIQLGLTPLGTTCMVGSLA